MRTSKQFRRTPQRLQGYDYTKTGLYYVTICTKYREDFLCNIRDDSSVALTMFGVIADQCWNCIPKHFPHVRLDEYIIMPDHIHGILGLTKTNTERTKEQFGKPIRGSLSTVIRSYKSAVTHAINGIRGEKGCSVWQSGFHEHIIRSEEELCAIRAYIRRNPQQWLRDNPENFKDIEPG